MKNRLLILLILTLIINLIFGCAATSKAPSESDSVAKQFTIIPEKGVVYLYRTNRFVGSGGQTMIKVNGNEAGGTGNGTFFRWELTPGKYSFACNTSESSAIVEIDVAVGEIYFIRQDQRIGISDGRVTLKEVEESKGKSEVVQCELLVSSYHQ